MEAVKRQAMKQVAVQFSSVVELIDFVHEETVSLCEVNEEQMILTCELSQSNLDRAANDYHATLITEM